MKNIAKVHGGSLMLASSLTLLLALPLAAQPPLTSPQTSPQASVSQRIGITDITINYHRPGVKEREIWGALVPYNEGKPFPWRAGANENTTISFTHDVTVEGTAIPAGTYGLHMIPSENEWTIIFNKNNTAWGSFFYDESLDQARLTVKPLETDHREWLMYGFEDLTANSALAYLHWEKVKVPFRIEVDVHNIVVENMQRELTALQGFFWQSFQQAANYCLQNNTHHEQAMQWIDHSIGLNRNINNLGTKARLVEQGGNTPEAQKVMAEALALAKQSGSESDLNTVGYLYLQTDRVKEAIDIFKLNVQKYPDSWNVYDSLGEAYAKNGETKKAIDNYKVALEKAPNVNQKNRIEGILKNLEQNM